MTILITTQCVGIAGLLVALIGLVCLFGMTLLDTNEAADKLRLARRTLEKWRVEGKGPAYRKHGDRVYYTDESLERWSERQTRHSTSDET